MEANRIAQVTGTQNTWKRGAVRGGIQQRENVARSATAGIPSERHSYSIGPFTGPEKLLISYEINDENGAIKAYIIDPESGNVIREIDVKAPVRVMHGKGSLFKSVA